MKFNLTDNTFLIIIRLDTIERLENILASTKFLLEHFETNISVLESTYRYNGFLKKLLDSRINYNFIKDDDPILHRTMYLNKMLKETTTPFVSVWDADVITSPLQISESLNILRRKEADFVFPYEKLFLDTSLILRNIFFEKQLDLKFLYNNQKKMSLMYSPDPVGGAFFCNLNSYKNAGLEKEEFYGWGLEDGERYIRWHRNGYTIKRIPGPLFHLSHPRGINSLLHNEDQIITKTKLLNLSNNILQKGSILE